MPAIEARVSPPSCSSSAHIGKDAEQADGLDQDRAEADLGQRIAENVAIGRRDRAEAGLRAEAP